MGLVDVLIRPQRTLPGAALSATLARFAEQCRRSGGVPLRLRLPDNTVLEFGPSVDLTLRLRDPALLRELVHPTLGGLADAYVEGRFDIEGDLLEALPTGVRLVEAGGASVLAAHGPGVAAASAPPGSGGDRPALRRRQRVLSAVAGPSDGVLVRVLQDRCGNDRRSAACEAGSHLPQAAARTWASGCSMSAAAGAGWSCTPRRNTECAPSASRCLATRLNLHANGYGRPDCSTRSTSS